MTAEKDTEIMTHCVEMTAGPLRYDFSDFDGEYCHPFACEHAESDTDGTANSTHNNGFHEELAP